MYNTALSTVKKYNMLENGDFIVIGLSSKISFTVISRFFVITGYKGTSIEAYISMLKCPNPSPSIALLL